VIRLAVLSRYELTFDALCLPIILGSARSTMIIILLRCCVVVVVGKRRVELIRRLAIGGVSCSSSLSIRVATVEAGDYQTTSTGVATSNAPVNCALCRRSRCPKGVALLRLSVGDFTARQW